MLLDSLYRIGACTSGYFQENSLCLVKDEGTGIGQRSTRNTESMRNTPWCQFKKNSLAKRTDAKPSYAKFSYQIPKVCFFADRNQMRSREWPVLAFHTRKLSIVTGFKHVQSLYTCTFAPRVSKSGQHRPARYLLTFISLAWKSDGYSIITAQATCPSAPKCDRIRSTRTLETWLLGR